MKTTYQQALDLAATVVEPEPTDNYVVDATNLRNLLHEAFPQFRDLVPVRDVPGRFDIPADMRVIQQALTQFELRDYADLARGYISGRTIALALVLLSRDGAFVQGTSVKVTDFPEDDPDA